MGRPRYPAKTATPPPLPPERRTVGQLIAESIRLYYLRFWQALPLGLAAIPFVVAEHFYGGAHDGVPSAAHLGLVLAIESPVFAAAYVAACRIVVGGDATPGRLGRAFALGVAVFACFRLLAVLAVIPGLLWLSLVGLAVPVVLAEDASPGRALRRSVELARADFAHALGGLVGLALVTFLAAATLAILLHTEAANSSLVAITLAQGVLLPILLLGSAMLYVDQTARLRLKRPAEAVAA
jgi:hypothetical protein